MLARQSGQLLRELRTRRGLTQAGLARAASVSRTVVSRLERGSTSAVQTDVLDRLFGALHAGPRIIEHLGPDGARRLARAEHAAHRDAVRCRHYRLALELAAGGKAAAELVAKARERVALWRRMRTCSAYYADRWTDLLALPPRELARAMVSLGDWEDAMFQNTPWSWAWN